MCGSYWSCLLQHLDFSNYSPLIMGIFLKLCLAQSANQLLVIQESNHMSVEGDVELDFTYLEASFFCCGLDLMPKLWEAQCSR